MQDRTELQVSHATAALDGDAATIALTTDQGNVTLRMHRLDLGALGGSIARALWPKAGESIPTLPELDEAQAEPVVALADPEPEAVPTQPELDEPEAYASAAVVPPEPDSIPTQPELHEPDAEPAETSAETRPQ
jgi:hypothetical protein